MSERTRTPVILGWSGGKDSALALEALRLDAAFDLRGLVTTVTMPYDRVSIHGVRRSLLHEQAKAVGLPLWEATVQANCSNADYEAALSACWQRVRGEHPDVETFAFGDLFLQDIRAYREQLGARLGFRVVFPVWGRNTAQLARDFVRRGFEARLVCVDTTQLSASFAGRLYDDACLNELPPSVDPCGENGEFHTFVARGPTFSTRVPYEVGEVILRDNRFSYCDLLPAQPVTAP
jgi:uncharacterized protein (TIGR00290 family)